MKVNDFFPNWSELTSAQQEQLASGASKRTVQKSAVVHSSSLDCTGLLLVERRQLCAYILSDKGREITLYSPRQDDRNYQKWYPFFIKLHALPVFHLLLILVFHETV